MASVDLREELNCSVCLNIFIDPVMLSCGHNFCRVCIGNVLDTQDGAGVYTCPECRTEFTERPALQRNMKLCNIAERFLPAQPEREDSGIFCTYCIDAPVPAAKTCLHCEASLCDLHLSVHSKSTEHVLKEPIPSMETRKCSIHKEALKYYCPQDAVCVCVSCCLVGGHSGHQVCSMDKTMKMKKEKMRNALEKITLRREVAKKRVQVLEKHKVKVQEKAAGLEERVTGFFQDIRQKLETLEGKVLSEISSQEEQVSLRVSDLIKQMKKKLTQNLSLLKDMCKETDPLTFLQDQESHKALFIDTNKEEEEEKYNKMSLEGLDEFLISLCLHKDLAHIIADVTTKSGFHVPMPSGILLDENMAAYDVSVSSDLKTASASNEYLQRSLCLERFQNFMVFSKGTFASGRHYWEVEISNSGTCRVGVSYPSVEKSGRNSLCGNNRKSWCLRIEDNEFLAAHNSQHYEVEVKASCHSFGIFLDYDAGRLSFYELCDPMRHLHTFTARFTEPLHAAFTVSNTAWVKVRS